MSWAILCLVGVLSFCAGAIVAVRLLPSVLAGMTRDELRQLAARVERERVSRQ
jgi:hypothetical protein